MANKYILFQGKETLLHHEFIKDKVIEELRYITFETVGEDLDTIRIQELIEVLRKYTEVPEEYQANNFLDRFYEKHGIPRES